MFTISSCSGENSGFEGTWNGPFAHSRDYCCPTSYASSVLWTKDQKVHPDRFVPETGVLDGNNDTTSANAIEPSLMTT